MRFNFKEISERLAQRAEDAARHLLPNGKRIGLEWVCGSVDNEQGQSLKVHLSGTKAGIWCDFASSGNQSGDLLDLWTATRGISLVEAIKEATRWLGITLPQLEPLNAFNYKRPSIKNLNNLNTSCPTMNFLTAKRKLTPDTVTLFKVSQEGNDIVFPYWRDNELIFVKYLSLDRPNGKKQIRAEKDCEPCLFGWQAVPPNIRTITICEGEIDAMTLHQYGFPALSVPFGGGTGNKHKWLEYEFDRLAPYDEIYLCFDNDEEGKAATIDLATRLGSHRCRIVELPLKDANDCLQAGFTKEQMGELFHHARTLDPAELKRASYFVDQVISEFYPPDGKPIGIEPPWDKAKDKILFRPDELSIWSGINGHGKSQFLGQIILSTMNQNSRVCIASLELKPRRLLARLTRQTGGLAEPSPEYIRAIHEWYGDRLWLFDLVGTAKTKRLLEVFLYAKQRYGVDTFVIDSFMKLDIPEDDYRAQKAFIEQLCDFKNQHNCHIHVIVHPRKGSDETIPPGKLDNKGTGAISDLADNCFTIWRNKAKEEAKRLHSTGVALNAQQTERLAHNDCVWICDKQRNGDWEGKIGLWFDSKSYQFLNHPLQPATRYVEFSITHDRRNI